METSVHELHKVPGVCYAVSDDGLELPVVDITHPVFTTPYSLSELDALTEATMRSFGKTRWIPHVVHRLLARKSRLLRGTLDAMGGVLGGMATYMLKIGPNNLGGGYTVPLDRKIASALTPVAMRLRLRDVASFLASGIAERLRLHPHRPVRFLNIAGGTAIDSINALLVLAHDEPGGLVGTAIMIDVLDIDAAAPNFGQRAVAALTAAGAPLDGVPVLFRYKRYDWCDHRSFGEELEELRDAEAILAVSSEGGLFEYGSDDDITAHLRLLQRHAPPDTLFVASAIRDVPIARLNRDRSRMPIRLFTDDALTDLVRSADWEIRSDAPGNPMYRVFLMTPRMDEQEKTALR